MSIFKKNCLIVLSLTLWMPILSGCWSSQELNDISIMLALGIDKQEDQYQLTAQVINPGQIASTGTIDSARTAVNTYEVTSDTLFEGIRKLTTKVPKQIYISHLRIVVISEELARNEGISKVFEHLSRLPDLELNVYIHLHICKYLIPIVLQALPRRGVAAVDDFPETEDVAFKIRLRRFDRRCDFIFYLLFSKPFHLFKRFFLH